MRPEGNSLRRFALALIFVALVVVSFARPASAATLSGTITDPVGDATWQFNSGTKSTTIPSYQDIATATISKKGNTFTFSMEMAGVLPVAPSPLPDGTKLNVWVWGFTTDLTFLAKGTPFQPGASGFTQFDVRLHWDGASFSAFLLDRRPLATGGEAVFSSVPFAIDGAEIRVFVDTAAIDSPTSFFWLIATVDWLSPHFDTDGYSYLDFAIGSDQLGPCGCLQTWPG